MQRFSVWLVSIACALPLWGCGILGLCGNSCEPGSCHTSLDCGCSSCDSMKAGPARPVGNPYYVIRRYSCRDRSNPTINPECDVTDSSPISCDAALQASRSHPDPCPSLCNSGVYDTDRYSDGSTYIQGGPCQGYARASTLLRHAEFRSRPENDGSAKGSGTSELNYTPIPEAFYRDRYEIIEAAAAPATDNSLASCEQRCASGDRCLRLTIGGAARDGLRRLQRLAATNPSAIRSADLQAMFGVAQDPCNRGDTTIESGSLINIGEMCNVGTQIPNSDLTIHMPEIVRGTWTWNSLVARVAFDDGRTRPRLSFSNDFLERAWGGDMVGVASKGDYVYFSVGATKCIRINLQ
jgi:hypothetical protein